LDKLRKTPVDICLTALKIAGINLFGFAGFLSIIHGG
jgi:hypothetical protein